MKPYLFLSVFLCTLLSVQAQYASRSTISFNAAKELNTNDKETLEEVYHGMHNLKYHCFDLVNEEEMGKFQQVKLIRLAKARASKIVAYYQTEENVKTANIFMKYNGTAPTLWLHKPTSYLSASGNIVLDDADRQCFPFNPSSDGFITSAHGNRFYFPANAFETLDGRGINGQNINICLWEFVDKKDLIYSGLTTDANGKMLETAGSFYIEASLNGQELRLIKGESYSIEMQADNSFPDMFTYYGGSKQGLIDWSVNTDEPATFVKNTGTSVPELNVLPVTEQGMLNLDAESEFDNKRGYSKEYIESEQAVDFYEMSAGKLGWINCDRFYEVKNTSTLAVRIKSDAEMVVRIVFKDINSVMPCYSNSNHKNRYEATGIPTGEKVMLLAYSVKDDKAILGYKEITIGENEVENIDLNNLSTTRFKSAVSELLSF